MADMSVIMIQVQLEVGGPEWRAGAAYDNTARQFQGAAPGLDSEGRPHAAQNGGQAKLMIQP